MMMENNVHHVHDQLLEHQQHPAGKAGNTSKSDADISSQN